MTNDPKQIGSLGQARTLMLKSMGMNRYNEAEAKAALPPHLQGFVANIFNSGGGDETPLDDSQRRSANAFFQNQLEKAHQSHEDLKSRSLNMYQMSPYFDASRGASLQSSMGKPIDDRFAQYKDKFKDLPTTATPPDQRPEPTDMVDKLRSFLTGGGPAAPQAAPAGGFDPDAYLKKGR